MQHYVINLLVTCGRSVVFSGYSTNRHDITEILLTVALSTIIITSKYVELCLFDKNIVNGFLFIKHFVTSLIYTANIFF